MKSKSFINVAVRHDTHKKLTLMKISGKAKNMDSIIKILIKVYNQYQKEVN